MARVVRTMVAIMTKDDATILLKGQLTSELFEWLKALQASPTAESILVHEEDKE